MNKCTRFKEGCKTAGIILGMPVLLPVAFTIEVVGKAVNKLQERRLRKQIRDAGFDPDEEIITTNVKEV